MKSPRPTNHTSQVKSARSMNVRPTAGADGCGVLIPSGMRRGTLTRSQSTLANRVSRTVRVVGSLSAAAGMQGGPAGAHPVAAHEIAAPAAPRSGVVMRVGRGAGA